MTVFRDTGTQQSVLCKGVNGEVYRDLVPVTHWYNLVDKTIEVSVVDELPVGEVNFLQDSGDTAFPPRIPSVRKSSV